MGWRRPWRWRADRVRSDAGSGHAAIVPCRPGRSAGQRQPDGDGEPTLRRRRSDDACRRAGRPGCAPGRGQARRRWAGYRGNARAARPARRRPGSPPAPGRARRPAPAAPHRDRRAPRCSTSGWPGASNRRAFSASPSSTCRTRLASVMTPTGERTGRAAAHLDQQRDTAAGAAHLPHPGHLLDQGGEIGRRQIEGEAVRTEPGQVEQVGHQPLEPGRLTADAPADRGLLVERHQPVGKGLRLATDPGQRRAQFVGHRGEEVALPGLAVLQSICQFVDGDADLGDLPGAGHRSAQIPGAGAHRPGQAGGPAQRRGNHPGDQQADQHRRQPARREWPTATGARAPAGWPPHIGGATSAKPESAVDRASTSCNDPPTMADPDTERPSTASPAPACRAARTARSGPVKPPFGPMVTTEMP